MLLSFNSNNPNVNDKTVKLPKKVDRRQSYHLTIADPIPSKLMLKPIKTKRRVINDKIMINEKQIRSNRIIPQFLSPQNSLSN